MCEGESERVSELKMCIIVSPIALPGLLRGLLEVLLCLVWLHVLVSDQCSVTSFYPYGPGVAACACVPISAQ